MSVDYSSMKDATRAVHAGLVSEPVTGAVIPPIFQTSTYEQKSPGKHSGFDYSRGTNPTRDAYEKALAGIEKAKFGISYSSGLAAIQAVIQTLEPQSEVIVSDDVYGGTGRLFRKLFAKYGITFHFVDMNDIENVKTKLNDKTKLIWIETPTNPLLKVADIKKISTVSKAHSSDIIVVVDNTFCSPIYQKPLELGADISAHSTTKYISGHSDVIGGALMMDRDDLHEKLKFVQFAAGSVPSPFECFLLHRSIRTLHLRMERHHVNVLKVYKFLKNHKKTKQLYFPGDPDHPGHKAYMSQTSGFSGMISVKLDMTFDELSNFLSHLKVFKLAESLGGVESLVNHPEQMTHASVPEDHRKLLGIDYSLLRFSVGVEDGDDLVDDLSQAIDKA